MKEARGAGQMGRNPVTRSHLNLEDELCVEGGLEQTCSLEKGLVARKQRAQLAEGLRQ